MCVTFKATTFIIVRFIFSFQQTQKRPREADDDTQVQKRLVDLLAHVVTGPSTRPENAYWHYLATVAASMHPDLQVEFHSKLM